MTFEIKGINYQKNSERFEQYSNSVNKIADNINSIKKKYGVESTEMNSFSPDLLSSSEMSMVIGNEIHDDYKRVLELTNENSAEYNFLWLGTKKELNGREYLSIEKAIVFPEPDLLNQSSISPAEKISIYDNLANQNDYDVIIDGHSHPQQDKNYNGFDELPLQLLDELSLKKPGGNYSISDLMYYRSLLTNHSGIRDKTIVGAVITYSGEMLTVLLDDKKCSTIPETIRQIIVDESEGVGFLPTGQFDEVKSNQFFK